MQSEKHRIKHVNTFVDFIHPIKRREEVLWLWPPEVDNHLHLQLSRCLTSSLYIDSSFLWMSPTTVVSSTKMMIWFPSYPDAQSCVSSVNNRLSTKPWGDPVLSMMELQVLLPTRTDWGLSVRKSLIQRHSRSGQEGGVSPLVSGGWWNWMLIWNWCTGFCYRCLSCPDEWCMSARWWIMHHLWSGLDDKQTGMGHVMQRGWMWCVI